MSGKWQPLPARCQTLTTALQDAILAFLRDFVEPTYLKCIRCSALRLVQPGRAPAADAFSCEHDCCVFNGRDECTPEGVDEQADWATLFPDRLLQAIRRADQRAMQGTQPRAHTPAQQGEHGQRQQGEQQVQEQQQAQTEQGAQERVEGQEQQGLQSGWLSAQHQAQSDGAAHHAGGHGGLQAVPQHDLVPQGRNLVQVGVIQVQALPARSLSLWARREASDKPCLLRV